MLHFLSMTMITLNERALFKHAHNRCENRDACKVQWNIRKEIQAPSHNGVMMWWDEQKFVLITKSLQKPSCTPSPTVGKHNLLAMKPVNCHQVRTKHCMHAAVHHALFIVMICASAIQERRLHTWLC